MNYKQLITEADLSPTRGDDTRAWMIRSGFVVIHSITLRRGKPGEYFELTPKAYEYFGGKKIQWKKKGLRHELKGL
jgi:hypothetical protein